MPTQFRRDSRGRVSAANLLIFAVALALVIGAFAWRFNSGPGGWRGWIGDEEGHEHDAGGFSSELLGRNESWSHTFEDEGDFIYACHPHPWMEGRVRVNAANQSALSGVVEVRVVNFSFEPAQVEVKPGTVVRWTNDDAVQHNVVQTAMAGEFRILGLVWWQAALTGLVLVAAVILISMNWIGRSRPGARNEGPVPPTLEDSRDGDHRARPSGLDPAEAGDSGEEGRRR